MGFTRWHFDYSVISFCPNPTPNGQVNWIKKYFYDVYGQYFSDDLGYIQFDTEYGRNTFAIINDGMESLTIRTSGCWIGSPSDPKEIITLKLTRIGP